MPNESLPTVPNTTTPAAVPIAIPTARLVPANAPPIPITIVATPYLGDEQMVGELRITLIPPVIERVPPNGPCYGVLPNGECLYFASHEALEAYRQRVNAEGPAHPTPSNSPSLESVYPTPPDTFTVFSPAHSRPPATHTGSSSTLRLGNATHSPIADNNAPPRPPNPPQ